MPPEGTPAESLSLAALKAENERAEKEAQGKDPEPEAQGKDPEPEAPASPDAPEPEQDPVENAPEPDQSEEEDTSDTAEDDDTEDKPDEPAAETPAWAKADDDDDPAPGGLPDSQAAQIRRKYKAQVKEKNSEIEELKQQIEQLQTQKQPPAGQQQMKPKPKRDDFDSDDEFVEALTDYKLELRDLENRNKQTVEQRERQQKEQQQQVSKAVDQHYERVHQIATQSNISPEAFQSADLKVRQAVENVFPDGGDSVTDAMIAIVGDGSERVMYNLGINPARLKQFTEYLQQDSSGLKASAYLGRLNAELAQPAKRKSNAPAPSENVQGDATTTDGARDLKRKWEKHHKDGNLQKAYDMKKAAKDKGIDTSSWR